MKHNSNTRNMVDGKKFKIASLAVALSVALITTTHAAEDIYYDGSVPSKLKVKNIIGGHGKDSKTLYFQSDSSNENKIEVKYKDVDFNIVGGFSEPSLDVPGIGKVPGNGSSEGSSFNKVVVEGNIGLSYGVAGGVVRNGSNAIAEGNTVEIIGNNAGIIYGAYVTNTKEGTVSALNNIVKVVGNNVRDSKDTAHNFRGRIYGGYLLEGAIGDASGNQVELIGNNNGRIIGGQADSGNANGNSVKIIGNMERWEHVFADNRVIIGGHAGGAGLPTKVGLENLTANNNTISFEGQLKGGTLYGGLFGIEFNGKHSNGIAENNTIRIHTTGNSKVEGNADLYGGYAEDKKNDNASTFLGNTLEISGVALKVGKIANFENYNFWINPELKGQSEAHLSADEIHLGTTDGSTASEFKVVGIQQGQTLYGGDSFLLLQSDKITGKGEGSVSKDMAQQGISVLYDIETVFDEKTGRVVARVLGKGGYANPQLKALSEGHLASLMQLTRAADMVAYEALDTIKAKNNGGLSTFFKFGGGHSRYDSGSHIKANDYHIMAGVSLRDEALTAAAFVEGGWGNYDTHNSFQGLGLRDVNGDGKNRYIGVGVIGQYDFAEGLYVDGSFRIGSSHNKFNASGIHNPITGEVARYSFSRTYVSAHAGLGYLYDLDDKNAIDFSAKYLWTHIGGKTLSVAGDKIKFNSLDSNRIRLSAIWNHQYSDSTKFKAGAGYEYEFSAKAKGTSLDIYSIDAPKVKGGTGILTLGMNVNPEANKNVDIDFNINGYAGKRDGVSASIKVGYNF